MAIAGALVIAACGGDAGNADAASSGAEERAAAATTGAATAACELPSELPDDTPLPPDCTWVFEPQNIQDSYLILETRSSAPQGEVVSFFEREMPALGWEIMANDDRDDGGRSLSLSRDDDRLILEIHPSASEDGALTVQYVLH